jgi:hypothetical protein
MKKLLFGVVLLILSVSACNAGGWGVSLRVTDDAGNVLAEQLFSGFHPEGEALIPLGSVQLGNYGECDDINLRLVADPLVDFGFNVKSNDPSVWFELGATQDVIPALQPANARASAGVSLTPAGGDPGATITGGYEGKVWKAYYNDNSVFSRLVSGWTLAPGAGGRYFTETRDENATGMIVSPAVTRIGIIYRFRLSNLDRASGTGEFEVSAVPEPGGLAAMLFGGVGFVGMALRRRTY